MRRTEAQIQAANERFTSMTPTERKVAIAKEVLAMLDAEKIIAERGNYMESWEGDHYLTAEEVVAADATCRACAVGAATLAACRLFNRDEADTAIYGSAMQRYLLNFFTATEVCQMENAFEGSTFNGGEHDEGFKNQLSWARRMAAQVMIGRDFNDDEALRLIFTQIAETGAFVVPA